MNRKLKQAMQVFLFILLVVVLFGGPIWLVFKEDNCFNRSAYLTEHSPETLEAVIIEKWVNAHCVPKWANVEERFFVLLVLDETTGDNYVVDVTKTEFYDYMEGETIYILPDDN